MKHLMTLAIVILSSSALAQLPETDPTPDQKACLRGDVNSPVCVRVRSAEVRKHPERATNLECAGFKAYEDPQPPGHPATLEECDRIVKEDQRRLGFPATGLSDEQIATYHRTWGRAEEQEMWRRLGVSPQGEILEIDMKSIHRQANGYVTAKLSPVQDAERTVLFDCHGHAGIVVQLLASSNKRLEHIPAGSFLESAERIVCPDKSK